ncbi:MAG: translocation/assembly module TamB domain-containing protein [Deltaproteobacteria bacterium]|nr:translocation/assembly module TamB domain-containing protein [Deltaproteobacteria bacterium]
MRGRARRTVLPTPAHRTLRRRALRWILRGALVLLGLVLLASAALIFVLATETGSEWAVRRVVQSIDEGIPGSIEFEYGGGTLLGDIRVRNVVIRDPAGYEVVRVADASARIDLWRLFDSVARFTDVRLGGVDVTVRQRKKWLGIVRAFREPVPEAERGRRPPGPWLFDLPDIKMAGVRVAVDLPPAAMTVRIPELDVSLLAGRGSHRVQADARGEVDVRRMGPAARTDRVAFDGRVESRTGRPVDAEAHLEQEGDSAAVRFGVDDAGLHAALRGDERGLDLERYLPAGIPGLRPGRARDLDVTADGPAEALAFHASARTDAGAALVDGRLESAAQARTLTATVHLDDARPVRLGAAGAPPGLAVSLDADLRADLSRPAVEADLTGVEITGADVPGGPWAGAARGDRSGGAVSLLAVDGTLAVAASVDLAQGGPEEWRAQGEVKLASAARLETPWLAAVGPLEIAADASGRGADVRGGAVTISSRGELRAEAAAAELSGPWSTHLDARPAGDGAWAADGWLLGEEGAALRAGETVVSGPIERDGASAGEPRGVPLHLEVGPDGRLALRLEDARVAAAEDGARGTRTTAPVVADLSLERDGAGGLEIVASVRSDGSLVLGRADTVTGPFLASAEATAANGEWRLVRASADAAGARHGTVRAGAIHAELEPAAVNGDSRASASVTALRSGRTRIGTVSVELVGDTVSGGGTVRLASGRSTASSSIRLRRSVETGTVEASLEGGLLRSRDSALRFHGTVRGGSSGLEIPSFVVEGAGAAGHAAGSVRGWRRLQLAAELTGLPLGFLFDFGVAPASMRDAVEAGRVSGHVTAGGTVRRPVVEFGASIDGLAMGGVRETRVTATGRLEGSDLRVSAEATLASGGAVVADLTQLPGSGLTVFVRADQVPLSLLRTARPDMPEIAGTVSEGSVLFVADEHAIEVQVGVEDFAVGDLPPIDGWIGLDCRGRDCGDRFRLDLPGDGVAEGDGRIALLHDPTAAPARAWQGLRDGEWLQHVAFVQVDPSQLGPAGPEVPSGSLSGSAVLTGSPGRPRGRAEGAAGRLAWTARPELPLLDGRVTADADAAGVRVAVHLGDSAGGTAEAVVEWASDPLTLLRDRDVAVRPDVRLAGTVGGELLVAAFPGRFVHAPAERVGLRTRWSPPPAGGVSVWSLSVSGDSPYLGEVPARAVALAIDGEGRRAAVRATVRNDEGVALQVRGDLLLPDNPEGKRRPGWHEPAPEPRRGTLPGVPDGALVTGSGAGARGPVPPEEEGDAFPDLLSFGRLEAAAAVIDATIFARRLDLGGVPAPPEISDMSGLADLDLAVHGPLGSPDVTGSFHVVEGGFVLLATAQRFTAVELVGTAEQERITLERVAAKSGGGEASLSGTIDWAVPGGFGLDLQVDSTDFPLSGEGTTFGRLTCAAGVTGTVLTVIDPLTGARRVDAGVEVGRCTLVLPRQRSRAVMGMGDHPDFVVAGHETPRPAESAESLAPWDVTVTLDAEGELSVRREDMQMTATGTLVFRSSPRQEEGSSVAGSVEVRRGWADMFGRRFDLEFGTVEFTGHYPVDGTIDVRLAAQTSEGPVYVDVTGTLRHPAVQLTSDPPRDQSEILALLFLGRTDVTSAEQLALRDQAGQIAGNVVDAVGLAFFQSEVASRISPLTVLRVDPGTSGFTDARLRAGMNVLSNLYVEYSYQLDADQVQNSNEGRVEWLILRNLSLEGNFGDAQSGGIHLQFRTEW